MKRWLVIQDTDGRVFIHHGVVIGQHESIEDMTQTFNNSRDMMLKVESVLEPIVKAEADRRAAEADDQAMN